MEELQKFVSSNGLDMVEGSIYNWRVEPQYYGKPEPFAYVIHMGGMALMYQALYDPEKEILSICNIAYSSDEVLRFYCATLWDAEIIVKAFIKANEIDMQETIYYIG